MNPALFEFDAYTSLTRLLDPAGAHVFVDAGAHAGNVSLRLAREFPSAVIHAFEPVGETFEILASRTNGIPAIRPVRAALGAERGTVRLNVNRCAGTSSVLPAAARLVTYHGCKVEAIRTEEAPLWTLDGWASANDIDRIDFIKIDVQGYELEVLKGADRLLRESVAAVYSEAQLVPLYAGAALFSDLDLFLRERGFEMYQLHEVFSNGPEQRSTCCDALWVRRAVLDRYIAGITTGARLGPSRP